MSHFTFSHENNLKKLEFLDLGRFLGFLRTRFSLFGSGIAMLVNDVITLYYEPHRALYDKGTWSQPFQIICVRDGDKKRIYL